jgi:hypothetical protein
MKYSRWVFIREGEAFDLSKEYADFLKNGKYRNISKTASSDWAIFNLYSVGFSHATISKITGVKEQTSKMQFVNKKELNLIDLIVTILYCLLFILLIMVSCI